MIRVEQDGDGQLAYQPIRVVNFGWHGLCLEQGVRTEQRCVWVNPASVAALIAALDGVRGVEASREHRAFVRGVEAMREAAARKGNETGALLRTAAPSTAKQLHALADAIATLPVPEDDHGA